MKLEGSGAAQLVQVIRQYGHNNDHTIELATIVTPPPALSVRLDGHSLVLDSDFFMVCDHVKDTLAKNDRVLLVSLREDLFVIVDKVVAF